MVRQTHASIERIVTRTADVSELIDTLADSGQAQSTSIRQVNGVVTDLDAITQQNAALVEEVSAASRGLSMEANRLATRVSCFNVGNHRKDAAAEPVAMATLSHAVHLGPCLCRAMLHSLYPTRIGKNSECVTAG